MELTNIMGARKARIVVKNHARQNTINRFFLVSVQVWRKKPIAAVVALQVRSNDAGRWTELVQSEREY